MKKYAEREERRKQEEERKKRELKEQEDERRQLYRRLERGKITRRQFNKKLKDLRPVRKERILFDRFSSASEDSPESSTGEEFSSETEDEDEE